MLDHCTTSKPIPEEFNSLFSIDQTPRRKRERTARHYVTIVHSLVNRFDAPDNSIEFIEACLAYHGYENSEFTATGAELASALARAVNADQRSKIRDRLRKQREGLVRWQNSKDIHGLNRPILVSIRPVTSGENTAIKTAYYYQLPIAGLVREVVRLAPVGASPARIQKAVESVTKAHLATLGLRRPSRVAKRRHSPASHLNRGIGFIKAGLDQVERGNEISLESLKNALCELDKLKQQLSLQVEGGGNFTKSDWPEDEFSISFSSLI